jgi:CheY-like chemotaxis protein
MVFGFIKQSGGHINVYSEPGRGTTFRLYLPPAEATATDGAIEEAPPLQPDKATGEMVLVVEDNAKLRDVVTRQLTSLGFGVMEAETSRAALDLLDAHGPVDLLFTDVVLPGDMDGCELAREVAVRYPQTKILLTSGFPGASLAAEDKLAINARLLSKPYRKRDLAEAIRAVLAGTTTPAAELAGQV